MSPRTGRRPGGVDTDAAILAAAREVFGAASYEGASVREVARRAGVDPALVLHYFGSKQGLFAAAMRLPVDPADAVAEVLAGPSSDLGERFVRALLERWGEPATRDAFLGLLRAAVSNPDAAAMLRAFVTGRLLYPVAETLAVDHPQLRAALAGSQLVGLAFARYVVAIDPLAQATDEELARCVGPVIQRYLMGPLMPTVEGGANGRD